jgi:acyl carrier protein
MAVPVFAMDDLMEILVERAGLPREAVTGDERATLETVGLDSLALLQLKAGIEDRYGVEIDERPDATFGEVLALVNGGPGGHAR